MRNLVRFLILFSLPGFAMADFDLREELGDAAFDKSGLYKLSEEELVSLNQEVARLLGRKVADKVAEVEQELPQGDDRFGMETIKARVDKLFQSRGPERIESRIVGEFRGWKGYSKFVLENGQVWQQSDKSSFISRKMDSPKVFIRRGALGSYLLKVEGYNSSVKVKRLE